MKSKVIINKINNIENKINSEYSSASKIIKTYGYFEFSKFLTTRETEIWTQSYINKMTIDYYEAFSNICHNILKLMTQACEKVEFRILEIDSNSLTQLAPTWSENNQPGRAVLWYKKKIK